MNIIKKHPYLSGVVAGAALLTGLVMNSERYSTLAMATVVEEKYVIEKTSGDKPTEKKHYVLNLEVEEQTGEGTAKRMCTLYVKENEKGLMPIDVLEDVISTGSTLFLSYVEKGVLGGGPSPIYSIGCFGTIDSAHIRVVGPGENQEAVRQQLTQDLKEWKEQELRRARAESGFYDGRHVW